MACVTPVVECWLERETALWDHYEGLIRQHIAPKADALPLSYTVLPIEWMHKMD